MNVKKFTYDPHWLPIDYPEINYYKYRFRLTVITVKLAAFNAVIGSKDQSSSLYSYSKPTILETKAISLFKFECQVSNLAV